MNYFTECPECPSGGYWCTQRWIHEAHGGDWRGDCTRKLDAPNVYSPEGGDFTRYEPACTLDTLLNIPGLTGTEPVNRTLTVPAGYPLVATPEGDKGPVANKPLDKPDVANTMANTEEVANKVANKPKRDRAEYQRELMRRKRAGIKP